MDVIARRQTLRGHIQVPGSKSHTIRALILATMAEGQSCIRNPLPSADCMSTAAAIPLIGAEIGLDLRTEGETGTMWFVNGAGKNLHAPTDVINVGNSGSLLYFLAPIAATFDGWSVFTGDASIRTRPVRHMV
ncbi:MAG: 3-phosphoshikimate 1-carboxyvinyltransferase, partial [Treponemataceae bacterium]|nr:3-phosphoshikimate 1-carboxyvinyltransferase [Treponemataceae bacterium]